MSFKTSRLLGFIGSCLKTQVLSLFSRNVVIRKKGGIMLDYYNEILKRELQKQHGLEHLLILVEDLKKIETTGVDIRDMMLECLERIGNY